MDTRNRSLKQVNLLVLKYPKAEYTPVDPETGEVMSTKDGKPATTHYLDVQVDHRDERAAGQTNFHLHTSRKMKDGKPVLGDNGKPIINNGVGYSTSQWEKMVEAGESVELENGATLISLKADLMQVEKKLPKKEAEALKEAGKRAPQVLLVNTKSEMSKGLDIDEKTMDAQFEARAKNAAQKAASKDKTAEKGAEKADPEAEQDAPSV